MVTSPSSVSLTWPQLRLLQLIYEPFLQYAQWPIFQHVNAIAWHEVEAIGQEPQEPREVYYEVSAYGLVKPPVARERTFDLRDDTVVRLTLLGLTHLNVGPALNRPPTVSTGGPYSVAEGGSVALSATGSDPDGDPLTYAWDLDGNGTFETNGQTPTFTAGDGPATQTITVRATDPSGASATASAVVTISNVAPIATFNAPGTAAAGSTFTLPLTSPHDPSAADTSAGFQYAFDCGSGYSAFSTASTRTCTAATAGTLSVGGKIRDKDGGVSEYRATVTITALNPYDQVCALARTYSSQRLVADAVCAELAAAKQEAAHGHVLFKQIDLALAQLTVALESGRAFTRAEANQLILLIRAL